MYDFANSAEKNNIGVIIAGAGGSAHLPGMIAALTPIPVLGVPIESKKLKGLDSLLSIAQMPKGIPVGTLAIGEDGAINAGLLAASIIANTNSFVKKKLYGPLYFETVWLFTCTFPGLETLDVATYICRRRRGITPTVAYA